MAVLQLRVAGASMLNPLIRELVLESAEGLTLPGFDAGAHIKVKVLLPDGRSDWRHYSLVDLSGTERAANSTSHYTIAVRREADGRGGSRFMHDRVAMGDLLEAETPKNDFAVKGCADRVVLIAGGIGVTPLLSMATQARANGRDVSMTYAGRSRATMAYLTHLQELLGNHLFVHADDEAEGPLDVDTVLSKCKPDDVVHVCGPKAMLDQVLAVAQARGWPRERVCFELFSAPGQTGGDDGFEVVLTQSGKTIQVPSGKSILESVIDAGCDPMYDCKRGECGVCAVPVVEGAFDHRDYVLSDAEKQTNKVVHICVSRATTPRVVLDL